MRVHALPASCSAVSLNPRSAWPPPLGATWDGGGVEFGLFSEHATGVELCLFDDLRTRTELARIPLRDVGAHVWWGYVSGIGPGQLYGYRVDGPFEPGAGHRFNPAKLLIDPYALALAGTVDWRAPVFGYPLGDPRADLAVDGRDDARGVPLSVVVDPAFDWGDDRPLRIPWDHTVLYEVHVKGFTARHPEVPEPLRGTYAGLASPPAIEHLQRLGVTAVELLPIHAFLDDRQLVERGLSNYWGYMSLGYFAPEARYAATGQMGEQVGELKRMVKALHAAGIEVILDVVYNHTGEGSQLGPTLGFRGIDNAVYYRLREDRRYYQDYTGCGNTLDVRHPQVLKLIMDSLRYWVLEMHVDGFRFDLATALAREGHAFDRGAGFFDALHQDPVLSRVKLIAEPWDIGEGGYQVGNFPVLWSEWNDKYRDAVRGFWRGDEGRARETAMRLAGSPDLYQGGRSCQASVNFVTAHDGFTLADLASYNQKHNLANGEENRDGENNNLSWNGGVEGPTDDPAILALRARQRRNLLATLLFSRGVPMLLGGDELGRTQRGNNNAYCQDSSLSWFDWEMDEDARDSLKLTRRLIRIRREQPLLRAGSPRSLTWLAPGGKVIAEQDWQRPSLRAFAVVLRGDDLVGETGRSPDPEAAGDTLLLLLNANADSVVFTVPDPVGATGRSPLQAWELLLDTARPVEAADRYPVGAHGVRPSVSARAGDLVGAVREPPLQTSPEPADDLAFSSGSTYTLESRSLALFRLRDGTYPAPKAAQTP